MSEGDSYVFEGSVSDNVDHQLFHSKKYNFIVDATSNQGNFSGGQIQFVLDTLNSQSQWVDLREAVVEFPTKITVQLTQPITGSTLTFPSAALNSIIQKNGYHQWIDGAQLIINGQTIQSLQQYENVAASFRILSSWSQDNLAKWGDTCGIALDDCTGGMNTSSTNTSEGLNNAAFSTVCTSIRGIDTTNNQSAVVNLGVSQRMRFTNTQQGTSNLFGGLYGSTAASNAFTQTGTSNVDYVAGGSNAATTYLYSCFMMATVRVRDLFDINEFPLVKNIRGFMYLNYNSFSVSLTGNLAADGVQASLASVSVNPLTGRSCPITINTSATTGLSFGKSTGGAITQAAVLSVQALVNGQGAATGLVGSSAPILTQARLVCPFYEANPRVDAALTKHGHRFSTLEKIVNPFTIAASNSINYILTVGVRNPRKLVLLPMWIGAGGNTTISDPAYSPFDQTPATSGPFAYLNQLQVYVANKPLFQYPINYDFEMYQSEVASNGMHGNVCDEMTSGLLTQQLWQQNHRYYTIDLARRMESEDGAAKSIQISCNNLSANYSMRVIAMVFYEKEWEMDTDMCILKSVA